MIRIGLGVTGSFCTFKNLLAAAEDLIARGYDITPVFSFNVASLDTRFFKAADFADEIARLTGKRPITSIVDAEPIGTSMGSCSSPPAPATPSPKSPTA